MLKNYKKLLFKVQMEYIYVTYWINVRFTGKNYWVPFEQSTQRSQLYLMYFSMTFYLSFKKEDNLFFNLLEILKIYEDKIQER